MKWVWKEIKYENDLLAELGQLSGVAAILRFPIADPEDEDEFDSSSDED